MSAHPRVEIEDCSVYQQSDIKNKCSKNTQNIIFLSSFYELKKVVNFKRKKFTQNRGSK